MYLIAGLGNPENRYEATRHNIGFRMIEVLAARHNIDWTHDAKHKASIGKGVIAGEKVILARPLTYMNLSGDAIAPLADYYKIPPQNIIVLYDDICLDVGKLRIRKKGSAGGHNGIKSIIARLGTEDFPRLRFGVGDKPAKMDLADYVLGRFDNDDEKIAAPAVEKACDAVEVMLSEGLDRAMNKYN